MSQENVEVALRAIAAYDNDEVAWLETLDPEVEWTPFEEGTPSYGRESAKGVRQRWMEAWVDHRFDVVEVLDNGEDVVVAIRMRATGRLSGVAVEFPHLYVHVRVRGGKVVYIFEYQDRAEALEAAGLSE
jgi:ketosteroid isomerase-like protein